MKLTQELLYQVLIGASLGLALSLRLIFVGISILKRPYKTGAEVGSGAVMTILFGLIFLIALAFLGFNFMVGINYINEKKASWTEIMPFYLICAGVIIAPFLLEVIARKALTAVRERFF